MKKLIYSFTVILILLILFIVNKKNDENTSGMKHQRMPFYVGTYTKNSSEGIYKYSLLDNGEIDFIGLSIKTENPSFITKSADEKYLLAVSEEKNGIVKSFEINKDSLQFINKSSSGGAHPCFVSVNKEGYVLVANYTGGNVGLLKLGNNGKLSTLLDVQQHFGKGVTERQKTPHAHSVWFEPNDKNIISIDLGTDELIFSSIDTEKQKLIPSAQNKLKIDAGAGPRHLTFHPRKKWIYIINELNSTVSLLKRKKNNYYLESSFSTLPKIYTEKNTCADIHISNDGKFLYASNRGHNSIAIFSIETDGKLRLLGHESTRGNGPRNFALSPDNNFILVANQHTDNIVSFKRDVKTGRLEYVMEVKVSVPVCILF
ncbi:lactonase family protein [candidate division KSB1 bacterium]|nr:lactonase family protein [candidate division KSB1 bacterium]